MGVETALPKRLIDYIHDVGVRALDHLADNVEHNGAGSEGAVHNLVGHWRAMAEAEKQEFVDKVAAAVVEVVAASAMLPVGLKLGKKVAKKARKVIKKRTKALRKSVKALTAKPDKKAKKKLKKKAKKAAEASA
jgi:hypothetical protein